MNNKDKALPGDDRQGSNRNGKIDLLEKNIYLNSLIINKKEAIRFLEALGVELESSTFQTFPEPKNNGAHPEIIYGTQTLGDRNVLDMLEEKNGKSGVFIMVNAGNGKGRKTENVTAVRAVFVDLDGALLQPVHDAGMPPHIIVESSPGRYHVYWKVSDCSLDQFSHIQKALAKRFDGDPSVADLCRVMRLPGYLHRKKEPFITRIIEVNEIPTYSLKEIHEGLSLDIATIGGRQKHTTVDPYGECGEGYRTMKIVRVARSLSNQNYSEDEAVDFCITLDLARHKPPLEDTAPGKVEAIVRDVYRRYVNHEVNVSEKGKDIKVISAVDFIAMTFPQRDYILYPWLPCQGLAMVYAPRGIGKTHFALGVAYATTIGGSFLGWQAPRPRGVLYLDGEMPAVALQERITRYAVSNVEEPLSPFQIITPDLQASAMIDLTRAEDQRALQPLLDGIDLIIVDNISTLCRTGKESEGESWLPVQQWALQQRAMGRSVLFIHHAGKSGEQRGTSRREDVLDTVIALKRPADYSPDKGANFEVHFEKSRGIYGEDTKPFEAQLSINPISGLQEWTVKSLDKSTAEKVAALLDEGLSQTEIAEMLKITKGAVSKAKKKAGELGFLKG